MSAGVIRSPGGLRLLPQRSRGQVGRVIPNAPLRTYASRIPRRLKDKPPNLPIIAPALAFGSGHGARHPSFGPLVPGPLVP